MCRNGNTTSVWEQSITPYISFFRSCCTFGWVQCVLVGGVSSFFEHWLDIGRIVRCPVQQSRYRMLLGNLLGGDNSCLGLSVGELRKEPAPKPKSRKLSHNLFYSVWFRHLLLWCSVGRFETVFFLAWTEKVEDLTLPGSQDKVAHRKSIEFIQSFSIISEWNGFNRHIMSTFGIWLLKRKVSKYSFVSMGVNSHQT